MSRPSTGWARNADASPSTASPEPPRSTRARDAGSRPVGGEVKGGLGRQELAALVTQATPRSLVVGKKLSGLHPFTRSSDLGWFAPKIVVPVHRLHISVHFRHGNGDHARNWCRGTHSRVRTARPRPPVTSHRPTGEQRHQRGQLLIVQSRL